MKKTIIEIKQLAALFFIDKTYIKFMNYINNNQINDARLIIDKEILIYEDQDRLDHQFELTVANKLSDLVIDLIINEVDDKRKGEQIKSIAG